MTESTLRSTPPQIRVWPGKTERRRHATMAPETKPGFVWPALVCLVSAVALVPWVCYLALTLPGRERIAWSGFDVLLVAALGRTAWLGFRGKREMQLPAVATATLLVVDAWFDVVMSRPGWPRMEAVLLAVVVELPTAALAVYVARRASGRVTKQTSPESRRVPK